MTEYSERVIKRAKEIAAEDWANKIRDIHMHRLNSMWYEPEPTVAKDQGVTDITYNSGKITRNGKTIVEGATGEDLISKWEKTNEL